MRAIREMTPFALLLFVVLTFTLVFLGMHP